MQNSFLYDRNCIRYHFVCYPSISGEGNGTPLQYSCLDNSMDGGAWWAAVHGVAKSRTRLRDCTFTFHFHTFGKWNGNPLQCSCLENPRDGGAWWAAIYGVVQSWTWLKQLSSSSISTFPEKATAPHSSTLAWKIPWTEEPGGLQSMGSRRVGHDWETALSLFTFMHLENEMATHSSVLACRILEMGELGGLPSMGLYRVAHDWSDLAAAAGSFKL